MSRRPRVECEGAIYHVAARIVGERMGRGIEGNRPSDWLFRDERDHQAFMDVLSVVAEVMAVDPSELRVRRRRSVNRGVAARMLVRYAGLTQREIAGVLGFASSSTVGKQQQRLSGELAKSRKLRRCVQEIEARLTPLRRP